MGHSAVAVLQVGIPASHIACISHMMCDEYVLACLIHTSASVQAYERPAILGYARRQRSKSAS